MASFLSFYCKIDVIWKVLKILDNGTIYNSQDMEATYMSIDRGMDKQVVANIRSRIFSSVQFSRSVVSDSLRPHESQHARPPCPSPSPRVHSNSRPSSR